MKYLKWGLIPLLTVIFYSQSIAQAPTASGNVMAFSNVAAYEPYTEDETSWAALRTIAGASSTVTTMAEYEITTGIEDTLYPDFLKEVLNTDRIFQIGNYYIKIDLENGKGYVISSGSAGAYTALVVNDESATGMIVLTTDDEDGLGLLEFLESNPNSEPGGNIQERCRRADRQKQNAIETWDQTNEACDIGSSGTIGRTYGMDNKIVYQKAIFYFSLQSKIKSLWRCTYGGSWTLAPIYSFVDTKLTGTVKYRKRCGAEVTANADLVEGYYGGGDGIVHWRAYSGGRSLSHYDFNVDFGIRHAVDRVPPPGPPFISSGHYQIKSGY